MLWERAIACLKKWREHQGGMEHEGNSTENEGRCSKPEFLFTDIIYFHGGCYSAILGPAKQLDVTTNSASVSFVSERLLLHQIINLQW